MRPTIPRPADQVARQPDVARQRAPVVGAAAQLGCVATRGDDAHQSELRLLLVPALLRLGVVDDVVDQPAVLTDGATELVRRHRQPGEVRRLDGDVARLELARRLEFGGRTFQRGVAAFLQLGDAVRLDVEAHGLEVLAELDCERKAYVTQTDHSDAAASHAQFHEFSVLF